MKCMLCAHLKKKKDYVRYVHNDKKTCLYLDQETEKKIIFHFLECHTPLGRKCSSLYVV